MNSSLRALLPLFLQEKAAQRALVLATVVRTAGPTYTKPGAMLLIAQSGEYAGLLSGGCVEGDLAEHSRKVLAHGQPKLVRYDAHGEDDLLFGLGSGCEGAMEILLQRLDAPGEWQPMTGLASAWQARRSERLTLVVASEEPQLPTGSGVFTGDGTPFGPIGAAGAEILADASKAGTVPAGIEVLVLTVDPPARVLLLGGGPDALPVAQLSVFLGWQLTVIDHRPHYARPQRFPGANLVIEGGPAALTEVLSAGQRSSLFAAAIVMSHHFLSDLGYLSTLAASEIPYIGLLGPASRRERLLARMGPAGARLRVRLCSPVGLDLGADTPEAIALAIAAEIQGRLGGRERIQPLSQHWTVRDAQLRHSVTDPVNS
jgi:xanthine/CO dehydrogenase XdhC/CoxF family maturation factor